MLTVAVPAALASGACFALAGVLQQRAASREPDETDLSVRLLRRLARQPGWLGGIALALLAYGFQSLALAFGPLSLAQPLIVSEMVFAIPLSARLQRMREEVPTGYDDAALDAFADKARDWQKKGDVFIFMINGAKVRAPAAAMALQQCLGI